MCRVVESFSMKVETDAPKLIASGWPTFALLSKVTVQQIEDGRNKTNCYWQSGFLWTVQSVIHLLSITITIISHPTNSSKIRKHFSVHHSTKNLHIMKSIIRHGFEDLLCNIEIKFNGRFIGNSWELLIIKLIPRCCWWLKLFVF